jgi:hypothetical protein
LHLIGDNMMAEVARLCAIDVTDAHWAQFVTAHVGLSDDKADKMSGRSVTMAEAKRAALTGLYRTDIRVAPWAGTAWGVVQAVNTYNQHLSIVRNVNREERTFMRAIQGEIGKSDTAALATLGTVIGRELVTA